MEVDVGRGGRLSVKVDGGLSDDSRSVDAMGSLGLRWRLGATESPWGAGVRFGLGAGVLADDSTIAAAGATEFAVELWHHYVVSERLRFISQLSHGSVSATIAGAGYNGLIATTLQVPAETNAGLSLRYGRSGRYFGTVGVEFPIAAEGASVASVGLGSAF